MTQQTVGALKHLLYCTVFLAAPLQQCNAEEPMPLFHACPVGALIYAKSRLAHFVTLYLKHLLLCEEVTVAFYHKDSAVSARHD